MPYERASVQEHMAGQLDAFCERCGKSAVATVPAGKSGGKMLRRLGLGGKPQEAEPRPALSLCLGCRGYICTDCWNDDTGVCQTCQPLEGHGVAVSFDAFDEQVVASLEVLEEAAASRPEVEPAWPTHDLDRTRKPEHQVYVAPKWMADEVAAVDASGEVEDVAEAEAPEAEAPETEAAGVEAAAVAEVESIEEFDDRWQEILGRVQAVGMGSAAEEQTVEEPAVQAAAVDAAADEAAADEPPAPLPAEWALDAPTFDEPVAAADTVDWSAEWVAAAETAFEPEPETPDLAEPSEAAAVETEAVQSSYEHAAEPAGDEFAAAEWYLFTEPTDEPAVAFEEPTLTVQEPEFGAEEPVAGVEEPVAGVEEPVAGVEEPVAGVDEVAADSAVESPVESPVEAAEVESATEADATADAEEDEWAAVLGTEEHGADAEQPEPDARELTRTFGSRRLRRRVARPQARRPLTLRPLVEPPQPAPQIAFVEPAHEAGSPPPTRMPHLPRTLPAQPHPTTPWPMPAPPPYMPPPPPMSIQTIGPAPARYRPQVAPYELPKPPATRPCGNCGLELSAKVVFCRRCGTRQLDA